MKTKAEKKETGPQFFVKIDRSEQVTVVRERDPKNQWSGEDTDTNYTINGFNVVGEKDMWDFVLSYDPTGKTMYVVCAFYDTGDSFGSTENCLCLVSLQEHFQDAQAILRACESDYKAYQEKGTWDYKPLSVVLPAAGKTEEVYTGMWKGYFERLRELRVETLGAGTSVRF